MKVNRDGINWCANVIALPGSTRRSVAKSVDVSSGDCTGTRWKIPIKKNVKPHTRVQLSTARAVRIVVPLSVLRCSCSSLESLRRASVDIYGVIRARMRWWGRRISHLHGDVVGPGVRRCTANSMIGEKDVHTRESLGDAQGGGE
jgi:hypothetical protein